MMEEAVTTTMYQIHNIDTGEDLGAYSGATPRDAIEALAREAGYRDYAEACETMGVAVEDAIRELLCVPVD